MKGFLLLVCLIGFTCGAPDRPRTVSHHRYVHPPKTNYRYLPQLEDDEETPLGRQEFSGVVPAVTTVPPPGGTPEVPASASASPVLVEPTKEAPAVPASRPAGPPENPGGQPQRPLFRPPPKAPPKQEEEEEEDDESEEEKDDEDADEDENEEADDENDDEDDDEEEEEERKRQDGVTSQKSEEPAQKPVKPVMPVPVVVSPPVSVESSVEDAKPIPSVESNEVEVPVGGSGESMEELGDGMEALVPGYITEHGEVLVPVDTVSGDQHISIVPDPYTRQRHDQSTYNNYRSHPFYYQDAGEDYFGF